MANLDNLKKQAKTLVKWHRERYYPVAARLRLALPRFADLPDRAILDAPFTLAEAQQIVAQEAGYASWSAATRAFDKASAKQPGEAPPKTRLCAAYPQIFVRDVTRATLFYAEKLGFRIEYLYGQPAFYALMSRDGIGVNLRHVDKPVLDRSREKDLLSANIVVDGVKELFLEFQARGVEMAQRLKPQPWGASDFIVRDPFDNLLCFASVASAFDEAATD
jgi:catechol 2,3-dioxygenase-like lactoylglutathione lyase family enzyme